MKPALKLDIRLFQPGNDVFNCFFQVRWKCWSYGGAWEVLGLGEVPVMECLACKVCVVAANMVMMNLVWGNCSDSTVHCTYMN